MSFIDSHAHLNFEGFGVEVTEIIEKSQEAGVETVITIGTSLADSKEAIEVASRFENVFATVGIHPNDDPNATVDTVSWDQFENLAKSAKVVGIGECGLDYSRIKNQELEEGKIEIARQKKLFNKQIEIANKLSLPLSIHLRDAQSDMISEYGPLLKDQKGVFHCFSGNLSYLQFIVETLPNFYFSFAGNLTYKNAQGLRELAKAVPESRLLIETDCPFLSPEPLRGTRNYPANVTITAQKLAEVRNTTVSEVERVTRENTKTLFRT